jgi:2-keto-3-deoxy-L-rhamnonate aldolase RhmA
MAVALGLDWVVIDTEHGHLDWGEVLEHVRATVRSETVALVRIAELNAALIKRVLDIGADGIVVPWVETAEQLRQAVAYAHYPPAGVRGIGGERATVWGRCLAEHVVEAEENVLVVPIIETVRAGRNIELLCQVPGVELFQFGPADYSSTAGHAGQWEGPGVAAQLLAIKDTIRRHKKQCGVLPTSNENLLERRDQGFRFLGLGTDASLLLRDADRRARRRRPRNPFVDLPGAAGVNRFPHRRPLLRFVLSCPAPPLPFVSPSRVIFSTRPASRAIATTAWRHSPARRTSRIASSANILPG